MAGISQTIIDAIRRIAKTDPEIRSVLGALQKRGVISGISTTIGGSNDTGSEDSCCTEANPPEDPKEPWNPGGDAPTDFPETPDGVTDCETGQLVSFNPQGFDLEESCKECAPDENWVQGFYFTNASAPTATAATPALVFENTPDVGAYTKNRWYYTVSNPLEVTGAVGNIEFVDSGGIVVLNQTLIRAECGFSTAEYCILTEAPDVCGNDWDPDNSTAYTLRNGCIVASKCDPEAATGDLGCNECKKLCKDEAEWTVCATSDGGFILYDETGGKKGGKYNEAGKRTDILNPGETGGYV